MGSISHHESCFDNYWDALSKLQSGRNQEEIRENEAQNDWVLGKGLRVLLNDFCSNTNLLPDPIHFFGNNSRAGEYVRLEPMRDVVFVLSACPRNELVNNRPYNELYYEVLPRDDGTQHAEQGTGQAGDSSATLV